MNIHVDTWDEHTATIFVSHDLEAVWRKIRCPARWSALAVFNSQLVLVGGMRRASREPTRELWSLEDEGNDGKWSQPLPAMPTARLGATPIAMSAMTASSTSSGGRGRATPSSTHHYKQSSMDCLHRQPPSGPPSRTSHTHGPV